MRLLEIYSFYKFDLKSQWICLNDKNTIFTSMNVLLMS